MKSLNIYVNEGLADWGEDDTFNKKISKQTSKSAIQQEIIEWVAKNTKERIYKNKFKFDFSTSPITVNYNGNIRYTTTITSLTSDIFQWGEVGGNFECSFCGLLESLEGAPEKVTDVFSCSHCQSLKSLKGAPKEVEDFYCNNCKSLKSLKGAPEIVRGFFDCCYCGTKFTENDVKKVSNVKGDILII